MSIHFAVIELIDDPVQLTHLVCCTAQFNQLLHFWFEITFRDRWRNPASLEKSSNLWLHGVACVAIAHLTSRIKSVTIMRFAKGYAHISPKWM